MKYSKWLRDQFPQLAEYSSVRVFNYVAQAKKETRIKRLAAFLANIAAMALTAYFIGYTFAINGGSQPFAAVIGLVIVIAASIYIGIRLEQRLIQTSLSHLVSSDVKEVQ